MAKLITTSSHGSGHTCLVLSKDGERAFTGGQDCIVRMWKMAEGAEQEPETAADADEPITSVAIADDSWLSGCMDSEVRRYFKDKVELDTILTSMNAASVRCIAVDSKGRRAAVGSDELFVKVIDMEDVMQVQRLEGHKKAVRRATWHPMEDLLTTCGSDGNIIVWDMSSEQSKLEKTIEGIIPAVADSESPDFLHDCSAVWHPSGTYFFVPTRSHEIVSISRSSWSKSSIYTDTYVSGPITALAVSINGVYLAGASRSKIHIWSTQTRRVVVSHDKQQDVTITQMAFSPAQNILAWTDNNGVFSRWLDPIPGSLPDPVKKTTATTAPAVTTSKAANGPDLFSGILETATGDAPARTNLDDDAFEDDWIVDDLGTGLQDEPEVNGRHGLVKEMVSITKAQPPFQPGSTPMENRKRYLAYNTIGVIEVTDQDTHYIVNIEFFDRSLRKGYHFTAPAKYDLGYLGERGAAFACPPEDDHLATLLFKPYGSWNASEREWSYQLNAKGTTILGIAAGGPVLSSNTRPSSDDALQGLGNVVIATTENDLTFLSGTGRERRIMGLGGDFVSMVAGPEWVFVVYRAGSTTIDGSQNLSYCIINFEDFTIRQRDILPVPKGHTLKWIGITEQGAPAIYDSAEHVHILTKYRIPHHASWARILDTKRVQRRQGKDESYWPVGINENTFLCLILKGRQEHPSFPRPLIQELPIQLPFRSVGDPKLEQFERVSLHTQLVLDALDEELTTEDIVAKERQMDKDLIVLIQAACKMDDHNRAIELTKLLHQITSFDLAIKVAEFYHLVGLKEKIQMLKDDREDCEDRMVAARNKRKRWLKPDPPIRQIASPNVASSSKVDLLGDFRPPPAIERPGMARVTKPVIEKSRYSSVAPTEGGRSQTVSQPSPRDSPPLQDGKRKRDEFAETPEDRVDFSMPPPKQKTNPFAKKPTQDSKNPFARKADINKTINKSESFFEKVDAAEKDVPKVKGKEKGKQKEKDTERREGPKQSTLFGMLSKVSNDTKTRKGTSTKKGNDTPPLDSQSTDIDMSDPFTDAPTLVETQENSQEDSQKTLPDGWEETQIDDTQTQETLEETQPLES